jgi:hypothetical protein
VLAIEYGRVRQEPKVERDGVTVIERIVVPFFIGKHGPFTERMTIEEYHSGEAERRAEAMRARLEAMEASK